MKIYIGFFTYSGYDKLFIDDSEEKVWKAMKAEYYMWKRANNYETRTWKEALEYFDWTVQETDFGKQILY